MGGERSRSTGDKYLYDFIRSPLLLVISFEVESRSSKEFKVELQLYLHELAFYLEAHY